MVPIGAEQKEGHLCGSCFARVTVPEAALKAGYTFLRITLTLTVAPA
jgi:hypothetical protein